MGRMEALPLLERPARRSDLQRRRSQDSPFALAVACHGGFDDVCHRPLFAALDDRPLSCCLACVPCLDLIAIRLVLGEC
ncbi:hypothetical protein ACLOJK_006638 [Asimina triloba]